MHSLFGTTWGLNPGPFDSKSDILTTTLQVGADWE